MLKGVLVLFEQHWNLELTIKWWKPISFELLASFNNGYIQWSRFDLILMRKSVILYYNVFLKQTDL